MKRKLITLFTLCLVLCTSIFSLVACEEHTHVYDKQVVNDAYLKSQATWTEKATYYVSCECGEKGTEYFEHGELLKKTATEGLMFVLNLSKTNYTVTDYNGSATSVYIPETYNNKPVTSIADWAFSGCNLIKTVEISDSVTSIGDWAFAGCSSLEMIKLSNKTISVGDWAFFACDSLKSIDIPDKVTSISDFTFYNCSSLKSVTIGNSVTTIGKEAFSGCSSLKTITIPNTVKTIGDWAFYYCTDLTRVTLGNRTSIGSCAFYKCKSLTSMTIKNGVTSIGDWAFADCTSLKTIYCGAKNMPSGWDDNWLFGCNAKVVWGYN